MAEQATTNDWCQALGMMPPKLETVVDHPEANTFSLLLVALLERGAPMTLGDVALRFEQAGIAERWRALLSLQRCKPGRPPVYREGDFYHLDPHDADLDLWMFRLGLRPPKVARAAPQRVESGPPLPGPDTALSFGELDEGWQQTNLLSWSLQRIVIAVLDAHGGPLSPSEVLAAVAARSQWHRLTEDAAKFKRRGSAVEVLADARWAIAADAGTTLTETRLAVRDRIALARRHAELRPDAAANVQQRVQYEKQRAAHAAELASMSRALLVAYPPPRPEVAVLLDVAEHQLTTFVGGELASLRSRLATYEILGGVDVRALLRALDFEPGERRLVELGPPQKTKQLNKRGRTLKITTALLVQGSCGIAKPLGDEKQLAEYLANAEWTKLCRRLEADVKSLYALYEYGRLHGAVRLRWGFLDEYIAAPWHHRDEPTLYDLKKSAQAMSLPLEVVVGSAPGWSEPWSRMRLAYVEQADSGWRTWLVDEEGLPIDEALVQRARLPVPIH